jgi:hypothetical protein
LIKNENTGNEFISIGYPRYLVYIPGRWCVMKIINDDLKAGLKGPRAAACFMPSERIAEEVK